MIADIVYFCLKLIFIGLPISWIIAALGCFFKKYHSKCVGYLSEMKYLIGFYALCLIVFIWVSLSVTGSSEGVPSETSYHSASDLRKVTGVEFPDIVPVDSSFYESINENYVKVYFVPKKPLDKSFFKQLDKVCIEDSCCWTKYDTHYLYAIHPDESPLDRTNGTHPKVIKDFIQGSYIYVTVPVKGDTIIIEDGWYR